MFRTKSPQEWAEQFGRDQGQVLSGPVRQSAEPGSPAGTVTRGDVLGYAALVLAFLVCAGLGLRDEAARRRLAAEGPRLIATRAAQQRRSGACPAPTVRRGAAAEARKTQLCACVVSGAGALSYNGTYLQSGTYGGRPTYTNGTCWLYWLDGNWWLSIHRGDAEPIAAYRGTGAGLPANGWFVNTWMPPQP